MRKGRAFGVVGLAFIAFFLLAAGFPDGVNKFGNNADTDDTELAVWEGPDYSGPNRCPADTTAFTLYVSSTDAGDTGSFLVEGVDENWDAKTVEVTLAGLTFTQVGDASSWLRINRAKNASGTALAGNVYLHIDATDGDANGIPDTPSTDIKTVVSAGEDQTLQACYTIPDGYKAYLNNFCASALAGGAGNPVTFRLRTTPENGVGLTKTKWTIGNATRMCQTFDPPVYYAPRTMLEVTGISTGGASNAATSATFDLDIQVP